MAEHFRFFDSANPLAPDRTYNAQEFTDYFKALVTTGVMKGTGNELKVTTNGGTMVTTIDNGIAFLLGRYYENDSTLSLTHEIEAVGKSRIDRVVIRMDLHPDARNVKAVIKRGVASGTPTPPTLTQTNELYEISLAQVLVVGGQTFIDSSAITDERGVDNICPWAGSKIFPNFNDDALEVLVNSVEELKRNGLIDARTEKVTYYISSTGNDNNDGLTAETAFKTFHKAMITLKKINFGVREIIVGAGVSMVHEGKDYRTHTFKDYFGGELHFRFNDSHEFSPSFQNISAKIELHNFIKFDELGTGFGTPCLFENCYSVLIANAIVNRTGKSSSYAAFDFARSDATIMYTTFTNLSNYCIAARDYSTVFVSSLSGNMSNENAAFYASEFSILSGNSDVEATVESEISDGGIVSV